MLLVQRYIDNYRLARGRARSFGRTEWAGVAPGRANPHLADPRTRGPADPRNPASTFAPCAPRDSGPIASPRPRPRRSGLRRSGKRCGFLKRSLLAVITRG